MRPPTYRPSKAAADLLGLRALLALRHIELDALVLIQRPVASLSESRDRSHGGPIR